LAAPRPFFKISAALPKAANGGLSKMYASLFIHADSVGPDALNPEEKMECFSRPVANGTIYELRQLEPLDIVFSGMELSEVKIIDYKIPKFLKNLGTQRLVCFEAGGRLQNICGGKAQVVTDARGRELSPFYRPMFPNPNQTHGHFFFGPGQLPTILVRSDWSQRYHELVFKEVTLGRAQDYLRITIKRFLECAWDPEESKDSYGIDLPSEYSCLTAAAVAAIDKSLCRDCTGTHHPYQPHSRAEN
jgi:hypothetical protein